MELAIDPECDGLQDLKDIPKNLSAAGVFGQMTCARISLLKSKPTCIEKTAAAATPSLPPIPMKLISQVVTGPMGAETIQATLMAFKKALIERALAEEFSHHLGYLARPSWGCGSRAQKEARSG